MLANSRSNKRPEQFASVAALRLPGVGGEQDRSVVPLPHSVIASGKQRTASLNTSAPSTPPAECVRAARHRVCQWPMRAESRLLSRAVKPFSQGGRGRSGPSPALRARSSLALHSDLSLLFPAFVSSGFSSFADTVFSSEVSPRLLASRRPFRSFYFSRPRRCSVPSFSGT